ncbi:MAG TPA: redoxin domain-containing protein [Candidatus Dormibacteraeota bacterium]
MLIALLAAAFLLTWIGLVLVGALVYLLMRQHGQTLLLHEQLKQRITGVEAALQARPSQPAAASAESKPSVGLSVGSLAPAFDLPDLAANRRTLEGYRGKELVIAFFSTSCGFCLQMASRLGSIPADGPQMVLIANGERSQLERMAQENRWACDVLLAPDMSLMDAYQTTGTPTGYLLDASGRIASALAVGADALFTLARAEPLPGGAANGTGALTPGTPAPDFRLPDLDGRLRTPADYRGKPAMMVFFNPECGFCAQLAPKLRDLPAGAPQLIVMSRGDKKVNRQLAAENGWKATVLLEPGWEVASAYRTNATPTGYLIDAEGRIASALAVGEEGVLRLTTMLPLAPNGNDAGHESLTPEKLRTKQDAAVEKARAAGIVLTESRIKRDGLPAGGAAPDFTLPDLHGTHHSLADSRGKRVLLVFSDPNCGPCQALAPSLEELHRRHEKNGLLVIMVSKGDLEENRRKARELGLSFPILLQKNWEISREYAMFATPVGYLLDDRGVIAKDVAIGGQAILALANGI